MAERVRVIKGSRLVALGALALSLASAALFMVGVSGDPHEGPFWLAFLAALRPVFLCPLPRSLGLSKTPMTMCA